MSDMPQTIWFGLVWLVSSDQYRFLRGEACESARVCNEIMMTERPIHVSTFKHRDEVRGCFFDIVREKTMYSYFAARFLLCWLN